MTDERTTFEIPSWNLERLKSELEKLNRRADKIGCPHVRYYITGEYERVAPGYEEKAKIIGFDCVPHITVFTIKLHGAGPKIEGWTFVGSLDHVTLPGSVIVNTVPGETVPPEYYNSRPVCNHCGAERRRNDTFVLKHEDGTHKQVGRQCIRDFFGHDPSIIARFLERTFRFVGELADEERWFSGGGPQDYTYEHERVLARTVAIIKANGWVPRSAAGFGQSPTADIVINSFSPPFDAEAYNKWKQWVDSMDFDNPMYQREAEDARHWLQEQEHTSTSEYMHNLHVINTAESVPTRMFGYWCSLVAAYQRAQERLRLQQAERKLNEHFGEVGQRIELEVKVISLRYTGGAYGTVTIVRMHDKDGRTAIWFANTSVSMEENHRYRIKGTIKKHDEYRDWKQTVLNRITVLEELNDDDS